MLLHQTHAANRSACPPIGWVSSDFLVCLVWVEEKKLEIWVFFFFLLLCTAGASGGGGGGVVVGGGGGCGCR